MIAAERQIESLLSSLLFLKDAANKEYSYAEFCTAHFSDDPYVNTAKWSRGVTKQQLDERLGYDSVESDFQQAKISVKFVRIEKQHWARYLLAFVLPHSLSYRKIRAKSVNGDN
jgi:hypothetical protein